MRINPTIMSSAINRYEKAIRKSVPDENRAEIKDTIDISSDAKIYNNLIKASSLTKTDNKEKIKELKELVSNNKYIADPKKIADAMLE